MGYIKERMTRVNAQRPINPYAFSADNEVMPYLIVIDCTGQTATAFTYTLKTGVRVIGAWAIATKTNTSQAVTIQDNDGNAITDALSIATDKAIDYAATIDDANWDETKGNNLIAEKNDRVSACWVFIQVIAKK